MNELLGKMRGVLSAETLQFLDEMQAAVERGDAMCVLSWDECPFDPVYRTKRSMMLVSHHSCDLHTSTTTAPAFCFAFASSADTSSIEGLLNIR
jgi:hypothetical protein